jgi:hypothetical protein
MSVPGAGLLAARRAARDLPPSEPGLDWLEDLGLLVVTFARPLPGALRRLAIRFVDGPAIDLVRRHIMVFAAASSLLLSVSTTAAWALAEGVTNPLLIFVVVASGTCGFWVFCFFANRVMRIASSSETTGRSHRAARAARAALVGAGIAVPVSAVSRDQLWGATGLGGTLDSPAEFAAIVAGTAAVVAGVAFIASQLRFRATQRG